MRLVPIPILNDVNCSCCHHFIHWAYRLQYQCCGVNQPSDWKPIYGDNLPWTCCPKYWSDPEALAYAYALPGCRAGDATKVGCKEKLVQYVKEHLIVWLALGFTATILIQVYSF